MLDGGEGTQTRLQPSPFREQQAAQELHEFNAEPRGTEQQPSDPFFRELVLEEEVASLREQLRVQQEQHRLERELLHEQARHWQKRAEEAQAELGASNRRANAAAEAAAEAAAIGLASAASGYNVCRVEEREHSADADRVPALVETLLELCSDELARLQCAVQLAAPIACATASAPACATASAPAFATASAPACATASAPACAPTDAGRVALSAPEPRTAARAQQTQPDVLSSPSVLLSPIATQQEKPSTTLLGLAAATATPPSLHKSSPRLPPPPRLLPIPSLASLSPRRALSSAPRPASALCVPARPDASPMRTQISSRSPSLPALSSRLPALNRSLHPRSPPPASPRLAPLTASFPSASPAAAPFPPSPAAHSPTVGEHNAPQTSSRSSANKLLTGSSYCQRTLPPSPPSRPSAARAVPLARKAPSQPFDAPKPLPLPPRKSAHSPICPSVRRTLPPHYPSTSAASNLPSSPQLLRNQNSAPNLLPTAAGARGTALHNGDVAREYPGAMHSRPRLSQTCERRRRAAEATRTSMLTRSSVPMPEAASHSDASRATLSEWRESADSREAAEWQLLDPACQRDRYSATAQHRAAAASISPGLSATSPLGDPRKLLPRRRRATTNARSLPADQHSVPDLRSSGQPARAEVMRIADPRYPCAAAAATPPASPPTPPDSHYLHLARDHSPLGAASIATTACASLCDGAVNGGVTNRQVERGAGVELPRPSSGEAAEALVGRMSGIHVQAVGGEQRRAHHKLVHDVASLQNEMDSMIGALEEAAHRQCTPRRRIPRADAQN